MVGIVQNFTGDFEFIQWEKKSIEASVFKGCKPRHKGLEIVLQNISFQQLKIM